MTSGLLQEEHARSSPAGRAAEGWAARAPSRRVRIVRARTSAAPVTAMAVVMSQIVVSVIPWSLSQPKNRQLLAGPDERVAALGVNTYTIFMILLTVIFASSLVGQLETPPLNTPLIVAPKEGERFHAKCVKQEGNFWQFQYNEPENSATKTFTRDEIFDWEIEAPEAVQARFEKYYADQGFVKVPTAAGWIRKEDYEFARRAVENAEALDAKLHAPENGEEILALVEGLSASGENAQPGFLRLWGPQIALALGGLVLAGILVKLLILGGED